MKKSLLAAVLGLISVLIISCQVVNPNDPDRPSKTGIRGSVIINGTQDLSMCSIIAELHINGLTASVFKEIDSSKASLDPPDDPLSSSLMLGKGADTNIFSTVSDTDGNFELMDLPAGVYTVTALKEHTLGSVSTDVIVNSKAITEIDIVLTATGSISGTVQLDNKTEGFQGTFVYAGGTSYIAGTDYSGNFTINDIPTGVYDIIFHHDGYTSDEISGVVVNAASDTPLSLVNLAYVGKSPVINTVDADPPIIEPGTQVTLNVSSFDPDGDVLSYLWTCDHGTFDSDTVNPVTWTTSEEDITCRITVTVSDGVNESIGYVNVFVVPAGILEGNAWRGDFIVEDIDDLNFISHYDRVIGDLSIDNTSFTDLDPLENLTRLDGSLYIKHNSTLTSISGLINLSYIGGDLVLSENSVLTSLDGLNNIPAVGGDLQITDNSVLLNLDYFSNVVSVGGKLEISDNDSLTNLNGLINIMSTGGDLSINNNLALEDIDGLGGLTSIGGSIYISDNGLIDDLGGLSSVLSFDGDLEICDNIALTSIDSLDNITYLDGNLKIFGNINLEDLDGLSNITTVNGNLDIYGNDTLTDLGTLVDLDGLCKITSVAGDIKIMSNDGLLNLEGLSNITQTNGNLEITNNDSLIDLQGLINVTSVAGNLGISSNDFLIDLDGLDNITSLDGALGIVNNDGLVNIDALISLYSIGWTVMINENDLLQNLNGLSNLTHIDGNLYIQNNPSLPTSLAYDLLYQLIFLSGRDYISGNQE